MKNIPGILVSQFSLAGEILKVKYPNGINISLYFLGTRDEKLGLIKIQDLFYRGDNVVTTRAPRVFYPLDGDAVITEVAREKVPIFRDVTSKPTNAGLSWVYAYPMLDYRSQTEAVICLSGSAEELDADFQKDLHVVADRLAQNIRLIFEEANLPEVWKDSVLTLKSTVE